MESLINSFINYKKLKGKSEGTLKTYREDLGLLLNDMSVILHKEDEQLIQAATSKFLNDFFDSMNKDTADRVYTVQHHYSKTSLNKKISLCREFFKHCIRENIINKNENPIDLQECYTIGEKKEKKCLNKAEMEDIIKYIEMEEIDNSKNEDFQKTRDIFMYKLFFTTGIRFSEMFAIDMTWINDYKDFLFINIPAKVVKNNINKRVPITNALLQDYRKYIIARSKIKTYDNTLFLSNNGRKITSGSNRKFNEKLKLRCLNCKIDKNVTIHSFRHSFVTECKLQNKDQEIMQVVGGWKTKGNTSNVAGGGIMYNTYFDKTQIGELDLKKLICCDIL